MTILKDRLQEAMDKKSTDINSFIWKGSKSLDNNGKYVQQEKKLIDMNESELLNCYEHCKTMLYNKDTQNPGRYVVLELIADQRDRCGVELFLRHVELENDFSRFALITSINEFLAKNKETLKNIKPTIDIAFSNIPDRFQKLPISLIIDGCLDRLGVFNKKHITRTFILKQGLWLTPAESKDLVEYNENNELIDKLLVVRERLNIKDVEKLYLNSKGLNYTQIRALLGIKPNKKYSDLTTLQLETLRDKLLFSLEETVQNHISSWEQRMIEIEMVAQEKNYKL